MTDKTLMLSMVAPNSSHSVSEGWNGGASSSMSGRSVAAVIHGAVLGIEGVLARREYAHSVQLDLWYGFSSFSRSSSLAGPVKPASGLIGSVETRHDRDIGFPDQSSFCSGGGDRDVQLVGGE